MKNCPSSVSIDAYLRGELSTEESEGFEAHYFDCPSCFRQLAEQEALVRALKEGGPALFGLGRPARAPAVRWRIAGAAAALLLAIAAGVALLTIPKRPPSASVIPDGGGAVRGGGVEILGPEGVIADAPERLEWRPLAGAEDYRVTLAEGTAVLWTFSTSQTAVDIPADFRARLRAGVEYVWRVRAFTAQGSSLAVSGPVAFRIVPQSSAGLSSS